MAGFRVDSPWISLRERVGNPSGGMTTVYNNRYSKITFDTSDSASCLLFRDDGNTKHHQPKKGAKMQLKTILDRIQKFESFVYGKI
uniref:Uncharacterized protein n=1 Tax=Candidatus Kentrum sp. TC TaxID=2126339 RepID=A0A450YEH8_9GAMM|nr:MAG: hypothetical protein BECKTC1821D_GA0114238_10083 [Candidatus Kentron sp. TC]